MFPQPNQESPKAFGERIQDELKLLLRLCRNPTPYLAARTAFLTDMPEKDLDKLIGVLWRQGPGARAREEAVEELVSSVGSPEEGYQQGTFIGNSVQVHVLMSRLWSKDPPKETRVRVAWVLPGDYKARDQNPVTQKALMDLENDEVKPLRDVAKVIGLSSV